MRCKVLKRVGDGVAGTSWNWFIFMFNFTFAWVGSGSQSEIHIEDIKSSCLKFTAQPEVHITNILSKIKRL